MLRVLHCFILLRQHEYAKATIKQLLIIFHQRQFRDIDDIYNGTIDNFHCLNEEVGEISLSMLARSLLNDTNVRDSEHVSKKYSRIAEVHSILGQDGFGQVRTFHGERSSRLECRTTDPIYASVDRYFVSHDV